MKFITFAQEISDIKLLHNHHVGIHLKFSNISLLMNTDQQNILTEISTIDFINVI